MSIKSGKNLYINFNNLSSVSSLYFHNDTSPDGASIKLDTATNDFTISDDLVLEGALTTEDKINPINIDQNSASDTDLLSWDTDTSRWVPATTPEETASKEYAYFYLTTGGLTNVSSSASLLVVDATGYSSSGNFALSSNVLTIHKAGDYELIVECVFGLVADTRSEYFINTSRTGGSADFASQGVMYMKGNDFQSTGVFTLQANAIAGTTFRFYVRRSVGSGTTGYQEDYGTRVIIREL